MVWLAPVGVLLLMSAAHEHWWGGFSPAGRFLVPALPLVALIGSIALRHRVFRITSLVLLIPQAFIAADGWQHTRNFWPQGDGHNAILADLVSLAGGHETLLPSLRTAPGLLWPAALLLTVIAASNLLLVVNARDRSDAPSKQ